MTVSTHVYTAELLGSPNMPLSVKGGSITLDDSWSPHVQGTIDVAAPGAWGTTAPVYSAWTVQRRNRFANPRATSQLRFSNSGTAATLSNITDFPGDVATALRVTRSATTNTRWLDMTTQTEIPASTQVRLTATVRSSVAMTSQSFSYRPSGPASTTGQVTLTGQTIPAGVSTLVMNFSTSTTAPTSTAAFVITGAGTVSATFDITKIIVEIGPTYGDYLDGSLTSTDPLEDWEWTGSTNASTSYYRTRTLVDPGGVPVWTPNAATWTALDPRLTKRVRVTVNASFGTTTQTRVFDLGLRSRRVNQADGTITLTLASDEALAADYAPMADDNGPFVYQSSLRAITSYVLGKIGATLNSSGPADVPVWVNYARNPRGGNLGSQYWYSESGGGQFYPQSVDGPDKGSYLYVLQTVAGRMRIAQYFGATGGPGIYNRTDGIAVTPGEVLSIEVSLRTWIPVRFVIECNFNTGWATAEQEQSHSGGEWRTFSLQLTVPPGATSLNVAQIYSTADTPGNQAWDTGNMRVIKKSIDRAGDLLVWKAGDSAIDFINPVVQAFRRRLVCDENRVWTLRDETHVAPGSLSIRHAINLIDGDDVISRDSGLWFDAAVVRYSWIDASGNARTATDSYALNTPYTRLVTLERSGAYPGPGFAEYVVRRAQGRGRELRLTTVADWSARAEQPFTAVLEGAPIQVGRTSRVDFDLSIDEMTVTTRTTDTPLGAIDLLTGSINSKTGTINNLTS